MTQQIVPKTVIGVVLLIALTVQAASAQNYPFGPASPPSPVSAGSAINPSAPATTTPSVGIGNPNEAPPNASLLALPTVGTAPLTVDFYVGSANTPGSLTYEWTFCDSAESLLPAAPCMIDVYQNPGTYTCELELNTPQGVSTTVFTTITVKPHQG
jgi:PKD repeat protein